MFSGDSLYPRELYAFLPNSRMGDYLLTAESLVSTLSQDITFLVRIGQRHPAHCSWVLQTFMTSVGAWTASKNRTTAGEGRYPQLFSVNDRLPILAEPRWLRNWD